MTQAQSALPDQVLNRTDIAYEAAALIELGVSYFACHALGAAGGYAGIHSEIFVDWFGYGKRQNPHTGLFGHPLKSANQAARVTALCLLAAMVEDGQ